ncbi:MAG: hypothetical protein AAF621_06520, partial [Pseudomonadota bacterium]
VAMQDSKLDTPATTIFKLNNSEDELAVIDPDTGEFIKTFNPQVIQERYDELRALSSDKNTKINNELKDVSSLLVQPDQDLNGTLAEIGVNFNAQNKEDMKQEVIDAFKGSLDALKGIKGRVSSDEVLELGRNNFLGYVYNEAYRASEPQNYEALVGKKGHIDRAVQATKDIIDRDIENILVAIDKQL